MSDVGQVFLNYSNTLHAKIKIGKTCVIGDSLFRITKIPSDISDSTLLQIRGRKDAQKLDLL